MTIAATSPVKIYAFTGAGDYIFDFLIFKDTNVKCYHTDATTGAVTALTYSTDYTVDFTEGTPGGTVTVSWNTETDGTLEIRRALPFTQEVDWVNNNALDMGILEAAFDRATMLLQQMDAIIAEGSAETVWKGNWTTGTAYSVRDLVVDTSNNYLYVCAVTHTASAAIATDIASGYWKLILEPTSTNISDDAFGATWDGLTDTAASKNALYDELNDKVSSSTLESSLLAAVPAGVIMAYSPGYFTNGSNSGFTTGLSANTIAAANTELNPTWRVCDGSYLSDSSSMYFNGSGRYLPNLTDDRFIMGDTACGHIDGRSSMAHTHSMSHNHGGFSTYSTTLSTSQMPSHSHNTRTNATGVDPSGTRNVLGTDTDGYDTATTGGGGSHNHYLNPPLFSLATGPSTIAENRPRFLSTFYIIKVR